MIFDCWSPWVPREDLEAGCAAAHLLIAVPYVAVRGSKNAGLSRAPVARYAWKIAASS